MTLSSATCIECTDQPLDISFHPYRRTLVAAALVDGTVEVHDFQELLDNSSNYHSNNEKEDIEEYDDENEIDTILTSTAVHTQLLPSKRTESGSKQASCRAVLFSSLGRAKNDTVGNSSASSSLLYTGGTAGDLCGIDAERICTFSGTTSDSKRSVLWRIPNASKAPINVLYELSSLTSPSGPLLVTGDDTGGVRIWDTRLCGTHTSSLSNASVSSTNNPTGCVFSWKKHDDYISGFEQSTLDSHILLACSADCRLSVYDLRMAGQSANNIQAKENCVRMSDDIEDELLSIKVMKNGKKVVCGSADGVLNVWSYGTWGDISDRFPGHPKSIDALLKLDEDTLLTGSSDGLIRVVQIHPDKLIGVLGDHDGFPIEKLQYNSDKSYVGSVTHDNLIRLWDTKILNDDDCEDDKTEGDRRMQRLAGQTTIALNNCSTNAGRDSDDEWEDVDDIDMKDAEDNSDDDEDSDDDDDDDDDHNYNRGKNVQRAGRFKTENEKFFEDL